MKIRKGGHRDLERVYSLMELDFDKRELLGKLSIHRALSNGSQELLVFTDENTGMDAAYALVFCKGIYGYVLLKYFGVMPWFRGKGVGVEAMRLINKRYAEKQGILAELTAFDDEDGSYLKKLKKFFARFGYVDVDSDYRLGGAPVQLMVKPIRGPWELSAVAHRIIPDFYSRCINAFAMEKLVDIRPLPREK